MANNIKGNRSSIYSQRFRTSQLGMPGANCSIAGCNTSRKHKGISNFRVPTGNDEYSKNWREKLIAIVTHDRTIDESLQTQIDNKSIYICELHYEEDQLLRHDGRTTRKPGTLPIINIPGPRVPRARKTPKKLNEINNKMKKDSISTPKLQRNTRSSCENNTPNTTDLSNENTKTRRRTGYLRTKSNEENKDDLLMEHNKEEKSGSEEMKIDENTNENVVDITTLKRKINGDNENVKYEEEKEEENVVIKKNKQGEIKEEEGEGLGEKIKQENNDIIKEEQKNGGNITEQLIKIETVQQQDEEAGDKTEGRVRRKTKSKYSSLDNNDLERMLKWRHGIGHLPDSNLKFRKSSGGALEVITPSSDEEGGDGGKTDTTENATPTGERRTRRKRGPRKRSESFTVPSSAGGNQSEVDNDKIKRKDRKKKKFADDELLKCETCGCYGLPAEFRSSGRFCSQRCVGAYASKRRTELIAQQLANGDVPLNKKKTTYKKRKSIKDSLSQSENNSRASSPALQMKNSKDDSTKYYETVGYNTDFCWETYLEVTSTKPASHAVFIKQYPEQNLFPTIPTPHFQPSMKLECVDPKHQSHICVVSVVETQGARMRLHFDGWSESYDFWINCDSPFLYPCGWCQKNGQMLTPPRGMTPSTFDWNKYLIETGCEAAPGHLFPKISPTLHGFTTNMKLEAVDRKNPDLICVASVNNVIGNHFLIHFDEWDDLYDYWCKHDSPFIHPVGWCQENQVPLVPPTDDMVNKFIWLDYLNDTNTIAAPDKIFQQINRMDFVLGTKLEVIDPRNPSLVRVGTVNELEDYRLKIHFDGWDDVYDYWFDYDSTDLHPVNWCKNTGHVLEPPPYITDTDNEKLCNTHGCRGIGHIKGLKYTTHHTTFSCPYTSSNINRSTSPVVDRLAPNAIQEEVSISNRVYRNRYEHVGGTDVLPDSTTKDEVIKKTRKGIGGRPKKIRPNEDSPPKTGFKRRRRRKSNEVTSSTSPTANIENYRQKRIPSTHRPAGQTLHKSQAIPWTAEDVAEFIKTIGYEDLVPCFKDNQIDGAALLLLSQADLVQHMKIKLGPALKIYSEISKL